MNRFMIPKEPHEGEHFTFAVKGRYYTIRKGKEYVAREKGKWVWSEENECWVCSRCELSALNNYRGNSTASNFCPNCGADMRKGENG